MPGRFPSKSPLSGPPLAGVAAGFFACGVFTARMGSLSPGRRPCLRQRSWDSALRSFAPDGRYPGVCAHLTHMPFPERFASTIFIEGVTGRTKSIGHKPAAHESSPRLLGCLPADSPCFRRLRRSRYCLGILLFRVFGRRMLPAWRTLSTSSSHGNGATASGADPLMSFLRALQRLANPCLSGSAASSSLASGPASPPEVLRRL